MGSYSLNRRETVISLDFWIKPVPGMEWFSCHPSHALQSAWQIILENMAFLEDGALPRYTQPLSGSTVVYIKLQLHLFGVLLGSGEASGRIGASTDWTVEDELEPIRRRGAS